MTQAQAQTQVKVENLKAAYAAHAAGDANAASLSIHFVQAEVDQGVKRVVNQLGDLVKVIETPEGVFVAEEKDGAFQVAEFTTKKRASSDVSGLFVTLIERSREVPLATPVTNEKGEVVKSTQKVKYFVTKLNDASQVGSFFDRAELDIANVDNIDEINKVGAANAESALNSLKRAQEKMPNAQIAEIIAGLEVGVQFARLGAKAISLRDGTPQRVRKAKEGEVAAAAADQVAPTAEPTVEAEKVTEAE